MLFCTFNLINFLYFNFFLFFFFRLLFLASGEGLLFISSPHFFALVEMGMGIDADFCWAYDFSLLFFFLLPRQNFLIQSPFLRRGGEFSRYNNVFLSPTICVLRIYLLVYQKKFSIISTRALYKQRRIFNSRWKI